MNEEQDWTTPKSFNAALEQMARFLRSHTKLKERQTQPLPSSPLSASFKNRLEQIAKLLRTETQHFYTSKKRIWKQKKRKKK